MTVERMRSNVDPFLLEILKSSFDTIADDMPLLSELLLSHFLFSTFMTPEFQPRR